MKVYILMECLAQGYYADEQIVLAAFANEEDAEREAQKLNDEHSEGNYKCSRFFILERILE